MGLDMSLYRLQYIRNWNYPNANRFEVNVTKNGEPMEIMGDPSYLKSQVMYWRKANAIHRWFVDNCQEGRDDCRTYEVHIPQLKELLEIITKVLENNDLAHDLLPTGSGFFFGSTEYDEWYFKDLAETKEVLEELIKNDNHDVFYEYRSSW